MSNDSDNREPIPPRPDAWASEVPEIRLADINKMWEKIQDSLDADSKGRIIMHRNSEGMSFASWRELLLHSAKKPLPLAEMRKDLERQEELLELLEKASELERRKRKYKRSDPAETWTSYWIASFVASLYPAERREEWLGDLLEVNREMLHKGKPRWFVNLINFFQTLVLIKSALRIKLSDFISWGNQKSE